MKTSPISFAGSVTYSTMDHLSNEELDKLTTYKPLIQAAAEDHDITIKGYYNGNIGIKVANDKLPDQTTRSDCFSFSEIITKGKGLFKKTETIEYGIEDFKKCLNDLVKKADERYNAIKDFCQSKPVDTKAVLENIAKMTPEQKAEVLAFLTAEAAPEVAEAPAAMVEESVNPAPEASAE